MRCFIALEIEDFIKDFCQNKISRLKQVGFKAKWVESNNFHLTLFFLGEIEETKIPIVKKIIHEIRFSKFKLVFNTIGYFFKFNKPSSVWLGIEKNNALNKLYNKIGKELELNMHMTFRDDFVPHVTLGRIKSVPKGWKKILDNNKGVRLEQNLIKVHLFSSMLTQNGPIYRSLI